MKKDSSEVTAILDSMQPVIAATVAYKKRLMTAGMSEQAAERMALQFHQALVYRIFQEGQ